MVVSLHLFECNDVDCVMLLIDKACSPISGEIFLLNVLIL